MRLKRVRKRPGVGSKDVYRRRRRRRLGKGFGRQAGLGRVLVQVPGTSTAAVGGRAGRTRAILYRSGGRERDEVREQRLRAPGGLPAAARPSLWLWSLAGLAGWTGWLVGRVWRRCAALCTPACTRRPSGSGSGLGPARAGVGRRPSPRSPGPLLFGSPAKAPRQSLASSCRRRRPSMCCRRRLLTPPKPLLHRSTPPPLFDLRCNLHVARSRTAFQQSGPGEPALILQPARDDPLALDPLPPPRCRPPSVGQPLCGMLVEASTQHGMAWMACYGHSNRGDRLHSLAATGQWAAAAAASASWRESPRPRPRPSSPQLGRRLFLFAPCRIPGRSTSKLPAPPTASNQSPSITACQTEPGRQRQPPSSPSLSTTMLHGGGCDCTASDLCRVGHAA